MKQTSSPKRIIAGAHYVDVITSIESFRQRPLITLYLNDDIIINDDCILPLYQQLQSIGPVPTLDLFIYSRGGTTETPWKIVSLIREYAKTFSVLVPYRAHSAATHVALGADEIVMGPLSELSPVDPTRMHPLLPVNPVGEPIPVSVQDLRHCLSFLKEIHKKNSPEQHLEQTYIKLFEFINPIALGAIEQSYCLARLISYKVLTTHFDPVRDKEIIDHIVDAMSNYYQSHNYTISRKEAKDELKLPVTFATPEFWDLLWNLYCYYREESFQTYTIKGQGEVGHVGFIDTKHRRTILRQIQTQFDGNSIIQPLGWAEYDYA